MAHVQRHHRGGGFSVLLLGVVFVLALLIGWAVWGGRTPDLRDRASDIDIQMPRAPELPAMPNPEPLPKPLPSRPG